MRLLSRLLLILLLAAGPAAAQRISDMTPGTPPYDAGTLFMISVPDGSGGYLTRSTRLDQLTATIGSTSVALGSTVTTIAGLTSVNKVAITAPATGSTLTIADGKTLTDTSGVGASILLGATGGGFAAYAGTSCTNQFPRSLSAAGAATCASVSLTADVAGILGAANGGTGNGFTAFTGPASSTKTFTLPNSSETLLYSGGPLGTPSSGTLTNATGLPISTGVSGLGAGVATFLATPSSANLASAVTGETGSGALVFGTGPTISAPVLSGTVTTPGTGSWSSDGKVLRVGADDSTAYGPGNLTGGVNLDIANDNATAGTFARLRFGTKNSAAANKTIAAITGIATSTTSGAESGEISFQTQNAGNIAERGRVASNGNWGVATSFASIAPQASLHVGGSSRSLRVDNSLTDASNGEWGEFAWSSNVLNIGTNQNGTGTARNVSLKRGGSEVIGLIGVGAQITGFLGIGQAPAAQLDIGSNVSAAAWTSNGIAIRVRNATYTDTSSSGTVPFTSVSRVGQPTLAASSATTYTKASAVYLLGPPVAGSNVTITNGYTLEIAAGAALFGGGMVASVVAPTVLAGQIGYGGTTAAAANCGSLAGSAGCVVINVAGTTRYVPYY